MKEHIWFEFLISSLSQINAKIIFWDNLSTEMCTNFVSYATVDRLFEQN